VLLAKQPLSLK